MTKAAFNFLVGLAIFLGVLYLLFGLRLAGFGGIIFIGTYSLTRNHNALFYLKVIAAFAALYASMWAGFGYVGYLGLSILFLALRQKRQDDEETSLPQPENPSLEGNAPTPK
jgi:hypothetical protein